MTIYKRIKVFAPATIANLGPGFDVLGVAINEPGDIIIAEKIPEKDVLLTLHGNLDLPPDGENVVSHVARMMIAELNLDFGVKLDLHKHMPVGSGLGSSGASSAASAYAVSQFLVKPLPKKELIQFAMAGERLASGAAHADNVAPSLLGGICLVRSYDPLDIIQLEHKNIFYWVVVYPHIVIHTKTARELLPTHVNLDVMVRQSGNIAGLIYGLMQGDEHIIARSMADYVAEPVRSPLITGYHQARQKAFDEGAIGFSISGSGPSVFAITTTKDLADKVAKGIVTAFKDSGNIDCDVYISRVNEQGACLVEALE